MIVDAARYVDGHRCPDVKPTLESVGASASQGGFAWIGLRVPSRDELAHAFTALGWDLSHVDAVLMPHTRPVLAIEPDFVQLVLRTACYSDPEELVAFGEVSVLLDEHGLIAIRHGQASALTNLRHELESQPERLVLGPTRVFVEIVQQVVNDYGPALDGFEHDVLEAEQEVFGGTRSQPTKRLFSLKREVRSLIGAIDTLAEPLRRLAKTDRLKFPESVRQDLLETIDELNRIIERTKSLSELIDSAIEANLTQVSLQQNEDMRKISAWAAMAAGPTLIAGVYGMNFDNLPELHWKYGYFLVLGIMAAAVGWLYRSFRRSGWL